MQESGEPARPVEIDVYVICAAADIAVGAARAFDLARRDESGEAKPLRIFVVRKTSADYVAYVNACPHEGTWLNIRDGEFLTPDRRQLKCGRHGARFEIDSGLCIAGPCQGASLEPVALAVIDGDLCLCGVPLVEDDGLPDPFDERDETMEIMIHPD